MRDRWGSEAADGGVASAFPGGAVLVGGRRAWFLIDDGAVGSFGAALAWARRRGLAQVDVLVADALDAAGVVARRAAELATAPAIWEVRGREMLPAVARPADSVASSLAAVPEEAMAFAPILSVHGVEVVVEHGVLTGEVLGLEIARVVADDGGYRLAVGVGHHDREARHEMYPGQDPGQALEEVAAVVRRSRVADGLRHPANLLARERWLRRVVCAHPELVGAAQLWPMPPPLPRLDLRSPAAAPAAGVDRQGAPMVVVCSVGVDVDLVPTAADARVTASGARSPVRLVLVVPTGDDYPVTRELAAALWAPAEVVTVPVDWPALGSP